MSSLESYVVLTPAKVRHHCTLAKANVQENRTKVLEGRIDELIAWSEEASQRWAITRFLYRLPSKIYTRDEAIAVLKQKTEQWYCSEHLEIVSSFSHVIDICNKLIIAADDAASKGVVVNVDAWSIVKDWSC